MFVVVKGPISPTYRDQTQLVGVAFMHLMARVTVCLPYIATLYCPIILSSMETDLADLQAGPRGGC